MIARMFLAAALAATMMAFGMTNSTVALDNKGIAPAAPRPTKMSPTKLSEGECTQLGGKVTTENYGICNSGRFCITVDENNKKHAVCISKM
jgi:hypothetical protein